MAGTSPLLVYDVVADYGASTSSTDNSAAFQNALNDAGTNGGIVFVPAGVFKFTNVLVMPAKVHLLGVGNGVGGSSPGCPSSVLEIDNSSSTTASPFITVSPPACIEGLQFFYGGQSGTNPTNYPATISEAQNSSGGLVLRNLYLPNTFRGILLGGNLASSLTSGRNLLDTIYIGAFLNAIVVDSTEDVTRINNVHVWPNFVPGMSQYAIANCLAIQIGRADGIQLSNIFILGCKTGVQIQDSSNPNMSPKSSYGQISNLSTDGCTYGIVQLTSYNPTGNGAPGWTVTNFYCAGGGSTSSYAVNQSPGGVTGSGWPSLQVLGGAVWGPFAGIVARGNANDVFRATLWVGYD